MEKLYWLLRNNIERGPFSIGDLLQQNLQSSDFIWVGGASNAWTPAPDIDEINISGATTPKVPITLENNPVPDARITLSRSSREDDRSLTEKEDFELRAQTLRKNVSMYASTHSYLPQRVQGITSGHRGLEAPDDVELIIHKSRKDRYKFQFGLACLVFFLFLYGWYRGSILNRVTRHDDVAAKPLILPSPAVLPGNPSFVATPVAATIADTVVNESTKKKEVKKATSIPKKRVPLASSKKATVNEVPEVVPPVAPETPVVEEMAPAAVELKEDTPAVTERKKTLGQAIKGLFKKKNKRSDTLPGKAE